jgi:hypothetical protein
MPLFFVVSGMAVYFSLVKRSAAHFARIDSYGLLFLSWLVCFLSFL